jgi:hypothetical protein
LLRAYVINQFATLDEWKTFLARQKSIGNPVTIEYATKKEATPIDISEYLDNDSFIAVEGGGSIVFKNEHEQAVPSTVEYIFKTEGE